MAVDDSYTISLLHFDNGLVDESGKIWPPGNGAMVSSTKSKFGVSSLHLNGTNQYLTLPSDDSLNFVSADFTIDFNVYFPASSFSNLPIIATSSGNFKIFTSCNTFWNGVNQGVSASPVSSAWMHMAFCRQSNVVYYFVNGVKQAGTWNSQSVDLRSAVLGKSTSNLEMYIDEIRISNVARWTSNFTPPTVPYGSTATQQPQAIGGF